MNACMPLLVCCAVAAADPPGDKRDAPDPYATRLAAATAIRDSSSKAAALLAIALDAAQEGQDDVVKKCMAAYPKAVTLEGTDNLTVVSLIIRLAAWGYDAEALEAAKAITDEKYHDQALSGIAGSQKPNPFWRACERGDDAAVAGFFQTVSVNAKDPSGETGLMKAAANGHVAVVKALLGRVDIEAWDVDKQGRTALMRAAENGQDAVVRTILTVYSAKDYPKDEPLNLTDAQGRTALMLAAAKGHAGVVHTLLAVRYAEPLKNNRYLTIERQEGPAAVSPFETSLVDKDHKDNDGKTALDLAEAGKHAGVVELLKK